MLSNSEIKKIRSLREKKFRDELGLFAVEGEKMVREALESGFDVQAVYRRDEIGVQTMEKISQFSTPSPVLAVVRIPAMTAGSDRGGLCLALDSVRDPGNMGTILRLSDWFGIDTVYMSADSVEIFNPKVIQSSMGSVFRAHALIADIPELCKSFQARGRRVYGTFINGEDIYTQTLDSKGLIIMGNESSGVSAEVSALVGERLTIPRWPGSGAESLNVATATAIVLSEFRRR